MEVTLGETAALLEEQGRYFSELYKLLNFKDEQPLKTYLDLILHEPVAWLQAFPVKYVSKQSFGKPKTAIIKLLKHERVHAAVGEAYAKQVHTAIWETFKTHADAIMAKRAHTHTHAAAPTNVITQMDTDAESAADADADSVVSGESFHSVKVKKAAPAEGSEWKKKYVTLRAVTQALLDSHKENSLHAAVTLLLSSLDDA